MLIMLADNATTSASKCKLENDLFLCPNQRCISLLKTCDGEDNCGDGHDENGSCSNGVYFDISVISQAVFDHRFSVDVFSNRIVSYRLASFSAVFA